MNVEKSKLMVVIKQSNEETLNIRWEVKQLQQIKRFENPGIIITSDGTCDEEINHRVHRANQIYYPVSNAV